MLETIQERIKSNIQNSISQIDTTVSVIEFTIQRIVDEHEVTERLLKFIDVLFAEKRQLLTLLLGVERLSKPGYRYPSSKGGGSIWITPNEVVVQANCLKETASFVSSDIDKLEDLVNGAFEKVNSLEIETMLNCLGEYRASALKFKDVCYEYSKYLRQIEDDIENIFFSPSDFSESRDSLNDSRDEQFIPPPQIDSVQFSAIAANRVVPGEYLPISIVMYEEAFRKDIDDIVCAHGENVKETKNGYHDVERNSCVRVVLVSSDVAIEDDEEVQKWNGKYLNFEFIVKVPKDFGNNQIFLTSTVYINDLIATKLKLVLDCEKQTKRIISVERENIVSAFISYASQDRNRVASIIQGMKKARPDMDIFFDVESLHSGQRWEEALKSEIDNRDILFLCWSKYAKESKWVDMEWRYALTSKGEEAIEPIPIDSPDVCPPPIELNKKHFNDRILFIIKDTMPLEDG